jgi:hypothetical protein
MSQTILTAHSEVFKSMLESDMKEANSGVIELNEFDVQTVKAFVEYLHFKPIENLRDVALELFKLADMYNIPRLKVNKFNFL